jgi:hypothetical protein
VFPYTDRHRWWYPALIKIMMMSALAALLYGKPVKVQRHWWNGNRSPRGRRDVYIRSDGESWEVEAQAGGAGGRSRVQQCPGQASAEILAKAWIGDSPGWREILTREIST